MRRTFMGIRNATHITDVKDIPVDTGTISTPTYMAVEHASVVQGLMDAVTAQGYPIAWFNAFMSEDQKRVVGKITYGDGDVKRSLGFRHFTDHRAALRVIGGLYVVVCCNGQFAGDDLVVRMPHKWGNDLGRSMDSVKEYVARDDMFRNKMMWENTTFKSEGQVREFMHEIYAQKDSPVASLPYNAIYEEYHRDNWYPQWGKGTAWRMMNCVTYHSTRKNMGLEKERHVGKALANAAEAVLAFN